MDNSKLILHEYPYEEPTDLPPPSKIRKATRFVDMFILMLLGVAAFIGATYWVDTSNSPLVWMSNIVTENVYRTTAIAGLSDKIVLEATYFCGKMPVDQQPNCVIAQLSPFYNYTLRDGSDKIKRPDEFVAKGGVCRDLAVFYASVFKRMGWIVYYNFDVPNHVFVDVVNKVETGESIRCVMDGLNATCQTYAS